MVEERRNDQTILRQISIMTTMSVSIRKGYAAELEVAPFTLLAVVVVVIVGLNVVVVLVLILTLKDRATCPYPC